MVEKELINKIFDKIINKHLTLKCSESGTTSISGWHGEGEKPVFDNTVDLDSKLLNQIADEMCERWGLEVSIDKNGKREIAKNKFSLWDDEHGTLIKLGAYLKRSDFIDFTNNGGATYDLDDVLMFYDRMPNTMKDATGGIIFENRDGACYNTLWDKKTDIINPIFIRRFPFYKGSQNTEYNLQQVLYHEGGHALEGRLTAKEINILRKTSVGNNTFNIFKCSNEEERKIFNGILRTHTSGYKFSNSVEYDTAMQQNTLRFASSYGRRVFLGTSSSDGGRRREDWADTVSVLAFKDLPREMKDKVKVSLTDGRTVGYDDFVKDHQATSQFVSDVIDGKITSVTQL